MTEKTKPEVLSKHLRPVASREEGTLHPADTLAIRATALANVVVKLAKAG